MSKKLIKTFEEENNFNNAIVPLSIDIDEVVFVYHHNINKNKIKNCLQVIKKYSNIKIKFKKIEKEELNELVDENTIIDITATKYISIALYEIGLKNNLEIIYYDEIEKVIKSYQNHNVFTDKIFKLKIEDIIKLGGGRIVDNMHKPLNKKESINKIFECINYSRGQYNGFINFVSKINNYISNHLSNKNVYKLDVDTIKKIKNDESYLKFKDLNLFQIKDNEIAFFNEEIKDIFMVSGAFLENYIYYKLVLSNKFDDVKMSVNIEFSGEQWNYPVMCELDCLVLKNNNLLFTSIKSNKVETDDLNEIKVHNVMFGNLQTKPVICTNSDLYNKHPNIYAKAEELGVYVVDEKDLLDNRIVDVFLSIIDNTYNYQKQ